VYVKVSVLPVELAMTDVGLTVTVPSPSTANAAAGAPKEARIRAAWTSARKRQRRVDRVEVAGTLHSFG